MVIVKNNTLQLLGNYIISKIIERTSEGIDEDGKPFIPYSSIPFAMPYGAYLANTTQRQRKYLEFNKQVALFRRGSGLWALIKGGYIEFKRARFTSDAAPNLQVRGMRGGMLGDLTIIRKGDNYVIIGFKHEESAKIAAYHQLLGAGKSRTIRKFLGLTDTEKQELVGILKNKTNFYAEGDKIIVEI